MNTFRYDLASWTEPRVILIENDLGKRSEVPRLGYVVLPSANRPPQPWPPYRMPSLGMKGDGELLERAINALEDLIDNFGPQENESYLWDEARKIVNDYNSGKELQS